MLSLAGDTVHYGRPAGPYPERRETELGPLDWTLIAAFAGLVARFERGAKSLRPRAAEIEALARETSQLSDGNLRKTAEALRGMLNRHRSRRDLVARAFAVIRETSARRLGLRPYPVQLMGGLALLEGRLVEMATGEGKTLAASLAAATAALAGVPTHVLTVNDYLAARDAAQLQPLYQALGISVGAVQHGQTSAERRAVYACDIVYGAHKEVAFDYLRDRLSLGQKSMGNLRVDRMSGQGGGPELLLRGLHFAIVDEADSVLIDEARTPLIIAANAETTDGKDGEEDIYATALALADALTPSHDYTIVPDNRMAAMTEPGRARLAEATRGLSGIWRTRRGREHLVTQALTARHLYQCNKHYVVVGGKVQIVDEFTGRIADGRSWQHGLHQLIEVKEGCAVTGRDETLASITYQRFFSRYLCLAGMSGTLSEVAGELSATYGLDVVRIPTHRPSIRRSRGVRLFRRADAKWRAVMETARREVAKGRPVLIATRSVADSERLGAMLTRAGCDHVVLNARHDAEEAAIVAEAGMPGRITVATNMAGRGTDIKLGPGVAERGGLHVILTEFYESARIDRQVIGRGGRQGDPCSYEAIVALDDDLFETFCRPLARLFRHLSPGEHATLPAWWAGMLRRRAQRAAQQRHYRMRRSMLKLQRHLDRSLCFAGYE
jgi:preprotein translocase subunit SecA